MKPFWEVSIFYAPIGQNKWGPDKEPQSPCAGLESCTFFSRETSYYEVEGMLGGKRPSALIILGRSSRASEILYMDYVWLNPNYIWIMCGFAPQTRGCAKL